jgi:hypothetical protein
MTNKEYLPHPSLIPKLKTSGGDRIPLSALLRIDPENLIHEYELQSPWMAVLQHEYGLVELQIERKEREIKEAEAEAFLRVREQLRLGGRVPNEATIKANVTVDERVKSLYQDLFSLREQEVVISAARLAFNARKEMLISLGAEVRLDKKSQ